MFPERALFNPKIVCTSELFPAPFAPITAQSWPSSTCRLMPLCAGVSLVGVLPTPTPVLLAPGEIAFQLKDAGVKA